ncbi:hypothetical protein [Candidatus Nitrosocosmicus sp. FF01]
MTFSGTAHNPIESSITSGCLKWWVKIGFRGKYGNKNNWQCGYAGQR